MTNSEQIRISTNLLLIVIGRRCPYRSTAWLYVQNTKNDIRYQRRYRTTTYDAIPIVGLGTSLEFGV